MNKFEPIISNIEELDSLIGGFFPGEVTVIGSRPATGKSSFLLALIKQITWISGVPGLFFSVEIPSEYIYNRLASSMSGIPTFKIRDARLLNEDEKVIVNQLKKQIQSLPLIINDKPDLNIFELCKEARELHKSKGIKIIYIDYLGLIKTDNDNQPIYEQVTFVIRKLKVLARELNIPIIITCQVARSAQGQLPQLQDLRGSGEVEAISDVIMLLHVNTRNSSNSLPAKLIVAKNHYGKLGTFNMTFLREILTFKSEDFMRSY